MTSSNAAGLIEGLVGGKGCLWTSERQIRSALPKTVYFRVFSFIGAMFVCVFRANNRIGSVSAEQLVPFGALETLDLSNNNLVEIRSSSLPALPLKNLYVSWG